MYYKKSGSKQLKQCKKYNYRIFENYNYSEMGGYEYYYVITDYKGNYINALPNYNLVLKEEKLIKERFIKVV